MSRKTMILAGEVPPDMARVKAEWYRRKWLSMADPAFGRPGTALKLVTKELGIGGLGCGCHKVVTQMDRWGPDECWRRRESLIRGSLFEVSVRAFNLDPHPIWLDEELLPESLLAYVIWRSDRQQFKPAIPIPEPPPLDLTTKHSRAIVTVATGEYGRAMLEISGPLMERYAARVGADFVVSDWPGVESWPMSAKYGAWRALDHYERIVYFDADVILRPAAVNLFDACEPDEVGAFNELEFHKKNPQHRVERHFRSLRELMGFPHRPVDCYVNCGVVVVPKSQQCLLSPPAAIPPYHCAEQDLFNARLQAGRAEGCVKFRNIERKCNWQHWLDHKFKRAPADAVLHFSGMDWEPLVRLDRMRDVANATP